MINYIYFSPFCQAKSVNMFKDLKILRKNAHTCLDNGENSEKNQPKCAFFLRNSLQINENVILLRVDDHAVLRQCCPT